MAEEKVRVAVPGGQIKTFKADCSTEAVLLRLEKLHGVGDLLDDEGDSVLEDKLHAGSYVYAVAQVPSASALAPAVPQNQAEVRLGKLHSLTSKEKGEIYNKLKTCGPEVWQREIPDFLDDDSVAQSLRATFLIPKGSTAQVAALAANVPLFGLDESEPTAAALQDYLLDFQCLVGLIPTAEPVDAVEPPLGLESPFFRSEGGLAVDVAAAIQVPLPGTGEQVSNYHIMKFFEIFQRLKSFSSAVSQLDFMLAMDRVETAAATSSSQTIRFRKRKRPDFLLQYQDTVFLFGEGKASESDFEVARNEISNKLQKVPDWVYGDVKFIVAFALGGLKWQLFVKRASSQLPEPITKAYNLSLLKDRVELVLLFFKLYFLCLDMCKCMKHTGMLPLFTKHRRLFSTIQLDGEGCLKAIDKWNQYTKEQGVSFSNVERAYEITGVDQLVYAVVWPSVSKEGTYMVRTGPLGLPANHRLSTEADCKKLAKDVLTALVSLHKADLVHRDIRLDNIIWWPERGCYVLIDLELVAKSGTTMLTWLRDYDSSTLVKHKYMKTSDLYQLGVLLDTVKVKDKMALFAGFVQELKSHTKITAGSMLSHAWLVN